MGRCDNSDDKDDAIPMNGSSHHHHDVELTAMEEENRNLQIKLQIIRERRRNLASLSQETRDRIYFCRSVDNNAVLHRQQTFQEYQSAHSRKRQVERWLNVAKRWNVTDDCFHIWYDNDFGTINQLRLGSESRVSSGVAISHDMNGSKTPFLNETSWYNTSQLVNMDGQGTTSKQLQPQPQLSPSPSLTAIVKVPWNEINSALGLVALLLSSLETRPQSNIKFQHEILPMGNTSKIGIRRRRDGGDTQLSNTATTFTTSTTAIYPLFSDDRFHFFGKRNFNMALNALLQCLAEAADEIHKRDRTMSLPHELSLSRTGNGEWTIGGLSVSYGVDGEQWTRAMKYFLTDLKWCVAYLARHVDR